MRRRVLIVIAVLVIVPWVWWLLPNGLYYQRGRPTKLGRAVNAFSSWLYSFGLLPSFAASLETIGYRTGKAHAIPVVLADYEGSRYIVSMLGERSPWVRNIRTSGGRAVITHGGRREVLLEEIPVEKRAAIIRVYVRRAIGARPHIPVSPDAPLAAFEAVAKDYPVFRITEPVAAPIPA